MSHAQVYSSVSASSDSGGNMAGPGGYVAKGDSAASVRVTTVGGASGTSSVHIQTTVNGTTHEETAATVGAATVSVQATPRNTTIDVQEGAVPVTVKHEVLASASSSQAHTTPSAAPAVSAQASSRLNEPLGLGTAIIIAVRDFFARLLGWFR